MIWVPDKEQEWILGEIVEDHGESVSVAITPYSTSKTLESSTSGEQTPTEPSTAKYGKDITGTTYNRTKLCEFDPSHIMNLDDLCSMNNLHEGPLIHILRRRWLQDRIYTYAGDILISINPYKKIPGLYDDPLSYYNPNVGVKRTPHVYAVANEALKKLASSNVNQSVIISGESGAGKTEASKYMISFLIRVNESLHPSAHNNRINEIVIDSGVIFEAFGNAKTVQNDNASRFGKYVKLQYTDTNEMISTANETFLLEKSRLVACANQERNYHVLYYLVRGIESVNPQLKEELALSNVETFKILTNGGCTIIREAESDATAYIALNHAIKNIGCSEEDIISLWGVLAAILHLGNTVVTEPAPDQESPKVGVHITSCSLALVAKLLGVEDFELLKALTTQSVRVATRLSVKEKPLSVNDSRNSVLALIRRLYHGIFTWLLNTINGFHFTEGKRVVKFLGILDICGFEIIQANSFEQLCINFTNERLQQQFNDSVFASEQELYQREGINWTTINFQDNQNVIDLIAKKPTGLLNLLEEHCMMNRAPDDLAILGLYHQTHGDRSDKLYAKPRFSKDPTFILKHFAGNVTYTIDGFIAKNYDSLQEDLTHLLQDSDHPFIAKLMSLNVNANAGTVTTASSTTAPSPIPAQRANKVASLSTVSSSVRSQLDALINALKVTEPHFIKVMKPNDEKLPDVFNTPSTMTQLRYSDIIEVVRIRRERFQARMTFRDFYQLFEVFGRSHPDWKSPSSCSDAEAKIYAQIIMTRYLPSDNYQFGSSLVFIREQGLSGLQIASADYLATCAITIQKTARRYLAFKMFQELLLIKKQMRQDEEANRMLQDIADAIEQQQIQLQQQVEIHALTLTQQHEEEAKMQAKLDMMVEEIAHQQQLYDEQQAVEVERQQKQRSVLDEAEARLQELLRLVAEQRLYIQQLQDNEATQLTITQQHDQVAITLLLKHKEEAAQYQQLMVQQQQVYLARMEEEQGEETILRNHVVEAQEELKTMKQQIQQKHEDILRQLDARKKRSARTSS